MIIAKQALSWTTLSIGRLGSELESERGLLIVAQLNNHNSLTALEGDLKIV